MDESEKAARLYGKIAKQYAKEFQSPSDYIAEFLRMVAKNGRILDAGCGPGIDTKYISSRGYTSVAIDLSDEMIDLAKERFPGIDFRVGDIRKLDFRPNSFDGVVVAFSLIHIPKADIAGLLKKLHGFLKPNGMIYIAVQEGKSQETFVTEPLKPEEKMFLNVFSSDEIEGIVKEAGFSILKERRREPIKGEFQFVKLFILAKRQ